MAKTVFIIRQLLFVIGVLFSSLQSSAQDPNFHIYLCFGQSNMAGAGDIESQDLTVNSRFQFMKPQDCASRGQLAGNWYTAVPPLWGCTGGLGPADYFGRTMVTNLPSNVKVGVIVVAIPGCKIELFGKTGYQGLDTYNNVPSKYAGSAYAWLVDLAKKAQTAGVIKGILLHQGESNLNDQAWPTKVKGIYDNLMTDLNLNASQTPLLAGELLYQNFGSCCSGQNTIIAKLPSVLPNSHVISASGLPGKDVYHFNSAGVRTFGVRYADKMLSLYPKGTPPTVSITSPVNNSTYTTIQTVNLGANAADTDGSITKVEFYDGTTLLGSDMNAPYTFAWSGMSAGTHSLTAKATDNAGLLSTSIPVSVTIQAVQAPFKGAVSQIPGRIEAEDYDLGGQGVAYNEANTNGNQGGATYRIDQVDIETNADGGNGHNVAYILNGEWLEYTVNVNYTGLYFLDLRVATDGAGKSLHLEVDGENVTGAVPIPNTGGWQNWQTVTVMLNNQNFVSGQKVIRIVFDSDYMNINWLEFRPVTITGLDDAESTHFQLYPNPFTEEGLKVNCKGEFKYKVTDLSGRLIESGTATNEALLGMSLHAGVYSLSIENKIGTRTQKIVKR